ncbi:unnamed protein product [Darwinula stevensoni]|uniref:G-protein coupled receptors family 1 profile domain-containing protein n=1 Tax=Darwinula stevensoni TaxID=69355 RepID=A0A7R8X414_9CRUS|nr:unnamed protein product [Darwinula stevensoni]CAG0885545.1 unnamed protein product [Darwinula stevensoni]
MLDDEKGNKLAPVSAGSRGGAGRGGAGRGSHVISASIFCCLIPGGIMVYCYVSLLCSIKTATKRVQSASVLKKAASREKSLTAVVVALCLGYWLAWLPYTCVSLITAFGGKSSLDPKATVIPVIMAKSSFAVNPMLYALIRLPITSVPVPYLLLHFPETADSPGRLGMIFRKTMHIVVIVFLELDHA